MTTDTFNLYNKKENLFNANQKILAAVSGGVDSVVLCHLLHNSGIEFGIAHINFQLRGDESQKDEKFVKKLAESYQVNFYSKKTDTKTFARKEKISIQMAARILRYDALEEFRHYGDYYWIATAHHLSDSIETIILNLIKGTGISGLRGILPKTEKIIRPLLFATKDEIIRYGKTHNIHYRTDRSNKEDKYQRNFIRHRIIPLFKEINPNFEKSILQNIIYLKEIEDFIILHIKQNEKKIIHQRKNDFLIDLKKLKKLNYPHAFLFEYLKGFGFNSNNISNIISLFEKQSGKYIRSDTHILTKDRNHLILSPKLVHENIEFRIKKNISFIPSGNFEMYFSKHHAKAYRISDSSNIGSFDYDLLQFPLVLRSWKHGDRFTPFGMTGSKKISDYLVDEKVPMSCKSNICVLVSGVDIIWLVGYRISEKFKITNQTKIVFKVILV